MTKFLRLNEVVADVQQQLADRGQILGSPHFALGLRHICVNQRNVRERDRERERTKDRVKSRMNGRTSEA